MINFQSIKQSYREDSLTVLKYLLGEGKIEGGDYVALNPRRADIKYGSFRIDIATGMFNDFATGDKGWSIIDLAAFVYGCNPKEAAERLAAIFPYLAGKSAATDIAPAKKKKEFDVIYVWNKSTKMPHQYLNAKKISIGNARVNLYKGKTQLAIPLTDLCPMDEHNLNIKELQFISENGGKFFPLCFKGLFHVASAYDASKKVIVIAEGYATARSIAQSTDFYVIAAMSAINLKSVVEKIHKQFPKSKIVIAADNDEAGRKAAKEALLAVSGISIVYPTHNCNDFNDLYVERGADVVKTCFMEVLNSKRGYNDR